jgi:hypothetical protein
MCQFDWFREKADEDSTPASTLIQVIKIFPLLHMISSQTDSYLLVLMDSFGYNAFHVRAVAHARRAPSGKAG